MDTEKYIEIEEKVKAGKPVTDEGPFYHHAWWEAYKGSVKGKLGGAVVGSLMGAVVGVAVAAIMLPMAGIGAAITAGVALTGIGLIKGVDEFSKVGTAAGAVSAGLDTAERRNRLYLDQKFDAIESKLNKLEAEIPHKNVAEQPTKPMREPVYRTDHFVEAKDGKGQEPPIFWKVAAVGLAVGLIAGAIFAGGGLATGIMEHLLGHSVNAAAANTLCVATFGAMGASFGINRDVFRKIFDHTDVLFRGMTRRLGLTETQKVHAIEPEQPAKTAEPTVSTVLVTPGINYPESSTYHRDKVVAAAKQALLGMDTSHLPPH